ncbi:hypothetical protein HB662_12860 [Roseomonas frigidaquae]|uniref:Uncharacterized protein n=1 Tax=Falsiroseomonas frigidaquae TaxID=487318 RepID=A0ABX1F052_9PROT|nr:hypothetical protein [Falsiroseomonas frigidaquae]NKE45673.1 hypothetical protein [Falsiroseomonas frigidaquae]
MTQNTRPQPIPDEALEHVVGGTGNSGQPEQPTERPTPEFEYSPPPTDETVDEEIVEAVPRTRFS